LDVVRNLMTSKGRFWCMALTLLAATAGFQLIPHGRDVSLLRPLASLPLGLAQWHGVDAPFEERFIKALAVDDYLYRIYRGEDGQPIGLYIAYYKSQRTDETIHSPQNCLPGAGWQPLSAGHLWLKAPDGRAVLVNQYIIQKGLDRQMVLYWYQSHGQTIASEYKAKMALVVDAIYLHRTDSALVRINAPITGSGTGDRAVPFATAILEELDGLIPK
jgi:EpsI family protein